MRNQIIASQREEIKNILTDLSEEMFNGRTITDSKIFFDKIDDATFYICQVVEGGKNE